MLAAYTAWPSGSDPAHKNTPDDDHQGCFYSDSLKKCNLYMIWLFGNSGG